MSYRLGNGGLGGDLGFVEGWCGGRISGWCWLVGRSGRSDWASRLVGWFGLVSWFSIVGWCRVGGLFSLVSLFGVSGLLRFVRLLGVVGMFGVSSLRNAGGLGVDLSVGDFVTFGIEAGIALGEDDDTLDEAPDTVTNEDDVSDDSEEAEDDVEDGDATREAVEGDGNNGQEEAARGEADVDGSPFGVAEVPVMGAESAEENAE